jgi:hypothetical protein
MELLDRRSRVVPASLALKSITPRPHQRARQPVVSKSNDREDQAIRWSTRYEWADLALIDGAVELLVVKRARERVQNEQGSFATPLPGVMPASASRKFLVSVLTVWALCAAG